MKISRFLSKVGFGAINLQSPRAQLSVKTALVTLLATGVLLVLGALVIIESGWYNLAADTPHFAPIRWMLRTTRDQAVRFHSRGTSVPNLGDSSLAAGGFSLYRRNCQPCHGGPGDAGEQIGRGINPKPPRLAVAVHRWKDSELYWIVSHGLKMSGMPAFAPRLSDTDRWSIVAFLRRLVWFSPADYKRMAAQVDQAIKPTGWPSHDDAGFRNIERANLRRGRDLLRSYGCVTCHESPGFGPGYVGPPLVGFAERQYIAGKLVNVPSNAVEWIMNPKKFKSDTAMPKLGVPSADAFDIAAYLYTSGDPRRIQGLRRPEALHR